MSNLSFVYQKLFSDSGFSFIVDKHGTIHEWKTNKLNDIFPGIKKEPVHIVPGSFNPLHESHVEIYKNSEKISNLSFFEMSVERVDKDTVCLDRLYKRIKQFENFAPVIISRAPRFVEKIGTYRTNIDNLTFHVGIDCITRMKDDYGLWGIQGLAANFIVYDRVVNGKHMSLSTEFANKIPINCIQAELIRTKESLSRSSTEIRNKEW